MRTSLPETAFITAFVFSRYLLNADFQYPSEMIIPIVFFGVVATVFFYLYSYILGSWLAARAATLPLMYALFSFSYLPHWVRNLGNILLPKNNETPFASATLTVLILAILCGGIGYGLSRLRQKNAFVRGIQLHRVLLFAVLFIFTLQFVKVAGRYLSIRSQMDYTPPKVMLTRDPNAKITKPDIYYFVFDRYGNADTLKSIYNYDNTPLMDYFSNQGFVNRPEALANYPFTMQSISSTMSMRYHTELEDKLGGDGFQSAFPYRAILNDPPVAQVLKENGYTYNQVSSWWDFTRVGIKADEHPTQSFRLRVFGKNFYFSDLTRDILNKSIMSPWLKKGLTVGSKIVVKYDNDNNPRQSFELQREAIKRIAKNTTETPQFTFAHVLVPHDPYVFLPDGSEPSYDNARNDNGVDEMVKYTNAVSYVNKQIEDMVTTIRSNSPDAVIIIQADEGPYPKEFRHALTPTHYYDPADLPLPQRHQKFGILATYYMPGVDRAIVASNITSAVNPFRFVLKQYLGYNLEMLPDCQFSTGNKFTIYNFKNQTTNLQEDPSSDCEKL